MICITGDASHDIRIPGLHRPRRFAQRHDPARATERDVIEPARREPKMLREADRGIRSDSKARHGKSIDIFRLQSGTLDQFMQRAA